MEERNRLQDTLDKFIELSQEDRDVGLVLLICCNASLSRRRLPSEMLNILTGVRNYMDWGLENKALSEIEHKKGIELVKGLCDGIVEYVKSQGATDDKE